MIEITNLSFSYNNSGKKTVDNISFNIGKGEIFGFLGPNGAGKTTTQRLIIGLLRGYEGSIRILGKERRDWNGTLFEKIGVAFDSPNLFMKLSAEENLKLISSYYGKGSTDIDKLLEMVDLQNDKRRKVENYSKGMKMRLNFIRAIMHDPDIIFLDEPTSGLDPVNARIIKEKILKLKESGKTIFLTTHNMNEAEQLCDRIAFINEGTISAIDSPSNLMLKYGTSFVKVGFNSSGTLLSKEFPLQDLGNNPEFKDLLRYSEIVTIHSQEATLEDVFIKLTGRGLI